MSFTSILDGMSVTRKLRIHIECWHVIRLFGEKKDELGGAASKLKNGLFKIDETREKVEKMSVELEEAKKKVAQFQKQCEEYLVVIVQQKREADEQQKVQTSQKCYTTTYSVCALQKLSFVYVCELRTLNTV